MAGEQKPSSNLLEQFILLAKGTSGSALTALISQVLEAPGVYVFGELLELANVQEGIFLLTFYILVGKMGTVCAHPQM
uniref:COP9 signalosome subunit 7B n=1 Tax=Mandrillus leucophaeus TaxID=9568 RepID=A0A2K5ZXX9_MANLE